jgi:hypothetical protein
LLDKISLTRIMNTRIATFAILASTVVLAIAATSPLFITSASAKITEPSCTNGGGNEPGGQQPVCQGGGLTQNPAENPAGNAPPGQQP